MSAKGFASELAELERRGLLRRMRAIDGAQDRLLVVDGREVVNFSSNNYLGLANHPEVTAAAERALRELGTGAGASRLIAGNLQPHRALEAELADAYGAEAALLFNSGYQANVGVLQAVVGRGDAVYSDELNHASIIDGCRLSRAEVHVFPHGDVDALNELLATTGARAGRRVVATDTLFSMDGDRARMGEIARAARRHGAMLFVDEAHAVGVLGPGGAGVAAEAGVRPDIRVGTLGKALGSFGAFALGRRELIDVLVNRARAFVFTTALPPAVAAASLAAVRLSVGSEGEALRDAMRHRVAQFHRGLTQVLGEPEVSGEPSHIVPVIVGSEIRAMRCSEALLERGIYAQGIRPPTVPAGTSRLRFALMATHTEADIARALDALAELARQGMLRRTES